MIFIFFSIISKLSCYCSRMNFVEFSMTHLKNSPHKNAIFLMLKKIFKKKKIFKPKSKINNFERKKR